MNRSSSHFLLRCKLALAIFQSFSIPFPSSTLGQSFIITSIPTFTFAFIISTLNSESRDAFLISFLSLQLLFLLKKRLPPSQFQSFNLMHSLYSLSFHMFFSHFFSILFAEHKSAIFPLKHCPLFRSCTSFFKNFLSLNTFFELSHKLFLSCTASLLIALLTIFLFDFSLFCNYLYFLLIGSSTSL